MPPTPLRQLDSLAWSARCTQFEGGVIGGTVRSFGGVTGATGGNSCRGGGAPQGLKCRSLRLRLLRLLWLRLLRWLLLICGLVERCLRRLRIVWDKALLLWLLLWLRLLLEGWLLLRLLKLLLLKLLGNLHWWRLKLSSLRGLVRLRLHWLLHGLLVGCHRLELRLLHWLLNKWRRLELRLLHGLLVGRHRPETAIAAWAVE